MQAAKLPHATRGRRHQAIRDRGFGDKLNALIDMLDGHRHKLDEAIHLLKHGTAHPINREALLRRAHVALKAIEFTLDNPDISDSDYGSLGWWGENGQAPRIDDLLTTARFHAGVGA